MGPAREILRQTKPADRPICLSWRWQSIAQMLCTNPGTHKSCHESTKTLQSKHFFPPTLCATVSVHCVENHIPNRNRTSKHLLIQQLRIFRTCLSTCSGTTAPWLSWLKRLSSKQEIPSSNLGGAFFCFAATCPKNELEWIP